MEFPTSEAEVIALAEKMIAGLTDNPNFPAPPVSAAELRRQLDKFIALRNAEAAAKIADIQATAAAEKAMNALFDAVEENATPTRPVQWN
jgi:ribosomal protein L17